MSTQNRLVVDDTWVVLRQDDADPYGKPAIRRAIFSRFPGVVLVRKPHRGELQKPPFMALCMHRNCNHPVSLTTAYSRERADKKIFCDQHSFAMFQGIRILSAHIIEMAAAGLITRAHRTTKKNGNVGHVRWYRKCINGCNRDVDVTFPRNAKRLYCLRCSYTKEQNYKGYDYTLKRHPLIVAWGLAKRKGAPSRLPLMRCTSVGCDGLVAFTNLRAKQKNVYCPACHGVGNKKKPFEARYNQLVQASEKRVSSSTRSFAIKFSLAWYAKFIAQAKCYYCNVVLCVPSHNSTKLGRGNTNSFLDRKDNKKGYTKTNVVACCPSCNMAKGAHLNWREMLILGALRAGRPKDALLAVTNHAAEIQKVHRDRALIKHRSKQRAYGKVR